MATTKVTLQIEPFDLQLICDGLTLYRRVMAGLEGGMAPTELGEHVSDLRLPIYNGDPGYCHGQANRLLVVMGLRSGDDRSPQLRMWGDDRVPLEENGESEEEDAVAVAEETAAAAEVELSDDLEEPTDANEFESAQASATAVAEAARGEQPWYSD